MYELQRPTTTTTTTTSHSSEYANLLPAGNNIQEVQVIYAALICVTPWKITK